MHLVTGVWYLYIKIYLASSAAVDFDKLSYIIVYVSTSNINDDNAIFFTNLLSVNVPEQSTSKVLILVKNVSRPINEERV